MTSSFPIASIPISGASTIIVDPGTVAPTVVVIQTSCIGHNTAGDVIRRALAAILVGAADAGPEADEYADGLDALNDYMDSLPYKLGYTRCCNIADPVTIPDSCFRGVIANLAIDLAPQYGGRATTALMKQAEEGLKAMRLAGVKIGQATLPSTLPGGAGNCTPLNRAPFAILSMSGNRRKTVITQAAGAVRAQGVWQIQGFRGLEVDVSGRVTNNSQNVYTVTVDGAFTLVGDSAIATGFVGIAKNNEIYMYAEDALTTDPLTILLNGPITMEPGEYIELVLANVSSTVDITLTDAILRLNASGDGFSCP